MVRFFVQVALTNCLIAVKLDSFPLSVPLIVRTSDDWCLNDWRPISTSYPVPPQSLIMTCVKFSAFIHLLYDTASFTYILVFFFSVSIWDHAVDTHSFSMFTVGVFTTCHNLFGGFTSTRGVKNPLTHQCFSYMSQFVWGIHFYKGVKNPLTHCDEYFKYLGGKSEFHIYLM